MHKKRQRIPFFTRTNCHRRDSEWHGWQNHSAGRNTVQGAAGQARHDVRVADGEGEISGEWKVNSEKTSNPLGRKRILQTTLLEDELQNPEIMTFKIINAEYIQSTILSGNIYFGCAEYYAYQEILGNKGQGDKDEGLYARIKNSNFLYIKEQEKLYGEDLITVENGEFLDLKLKSVINMPIYCVYSINANDLGVKCFNEPGETPKIRYRTYKFKISKEVFKDFSAEDFGILNFLNHTDLYRRIQKSLRSEGCKHILKTRIKYVNRVGKEWICPESHPAELFYKDNSFGYQKEGRIVVTDRKISFINEELSNKKYRALSIGNVKKIVQKDAIKIQDIRVEIPRVPFIEI